MNGSDGTILIAYDGSDDAAAAITRAGELLAPRRAVVVYVWGSLAGLMLRSDVDDLSGSMREAAEEMDIDDRERGESLADEGVDLATKAGFDAAPRPLRGKPKAWPALLTEADAVDAPAVVIGSRGLGRVRSALVGSVSSGLLHHAHRPVLVVPAGEAATAPGPPLIGFDDSESARAAIHAAGNLLARRDVTVETVWFPYSAVAGGGTVAVPAAIASSAVEELDRMTAARALATAREGATLAQSAGLTAAADAIEAAGAAWAAMSQRAEQLGSPLIVVGSRGRGAVAEMVLGSTSSALVHHARLPTLVVPPRLG